jgi:hypothetical protein
MDLFFPGRRRPARIALCNVLDKIPAADRLRPPSVPGPITLGPLSKLLPSICGRSASWQRQKGRGSCLPIELHAAFDPDQRHPEGARYLRLSRIAIDDSCLLKHPPPNPAANCVMASQEQPTGAREDSMSNLGSAGLAFAEKPPTWPKRHL